jgi:hypothetical protein
MMSDSNSDDMPSLVDDSDDDMPPLVDDSDSDDDDVPPLVYGADVYPHRFGYGDTHQVFVDDNLAVYCEQDVDILRRAFEAFNNA